MSRKTKNSDKIDYSKVYKNIFKYINGDTSIVLDDDTIKLANNVKIMEMFMNYPNLLIYLNEYFNNKYVYGLDTKDFIEYLRSLVARIKGQER